MGRHARDGWHLTERSMAWLAIIIAIAALVVGVGQLAVGVLSLGNFAGPGTTISASPRNPVPSWGTSTAPVGTIQPRLRHGVVH